MHGRVENPQWQCESAFQNGGPRVYVFKTDGTMRPSGLSAKRAKRAMQLADPGETVYARRKVGSAYRWVQMRYSDKATQGAAAQMVARSIVRGVLDVQVAQGSNVIEMRPEDIAPLLALAKRVAALNPDGGRIGEGMLRSFISDAQAALDRIGGK